MRGDGVGGGVIAKSTMHLSILTGAPRSRLGVASVVRMDCVPRMGCVMRSVSGTSDAVNGHAHTDKDRKNRWFFDLVLL